MVPISKSKVLQIQQKVTGERTQQESADQGDVSRIVLQAVTSGRHVPHGLPRSSGRRLVPKPAYEVGRCRSCGHLVWGPCLMCLARRALEEELREKRRHLFPDPTDPLRVNLHGEYRERYARIHARKVLAHRRRRANRQPRKSETVSCARKDMCID